MELKEIYEPKLLYGLEEKKKRIRMVSGIVALLLAALLFLAIFLLYSYALLCTAVCLLLLLSAYFILAVLIKIKLNRIGCYIDFIKDLDDGLVCEEIYTLKKVNFDLQKSEYGLNMRSVEVIQGTESRSIYLEESIDASFVPGEKYYINTVGKYIVSVGKYEDR